MVNQIRPMELYCSIKKLKRQIIGVDRLTSVPMSVACLSCLLLRVYQTPDKLMLEVDVEEKVRRWMMRSAEKKLLSRKLQW